MGAGKIDKEVGKPVLLRVARNAADIKQESTGDLYSTKRIASSKIEALHENGQWVPLASAMKMQKYSADQERDAHGRWTVGGAAIDEIMDRTKWNAEGHFMGSVNAATYDPAVIRSEYCTTLGKEFIDAVINNDHEL